jgi:hypothetical protein
VELGRISTLVTTCPKDLTMYRDAAKTVGVEDQLVVTDLVELVEVATRETAPSDPDPSSQAEAATTGA